jgi:hypothetical protein
LRQLAKDDGYNFHAQGSWWAEHRIERLNMNGNWGNPKKKWTRAVRAIALLEQVNSPDAVALLRALAEGHPDAQPTKEAKAALNRFAAQRPESAP